jgi:protein TonB
VTAPPAPPSSTASIQQQNATTAAPAGSGSGNEGAGSAGNGNVGSDQGLFGSGHGTGDNPDDYLDRVQRWINRYKKYPEEARQKKQEGTAVVAFTLARDGTVTGASIEQSSGNPLFDVAALQMVHDASPVPAVPQRYWDKIGRPITISVEFKLGFFTRILP